MSSNVDTTLQNKLEVKKLWKAVMSEMEVTFSGLNYNMYISRCTAENLTDTSIEVVCPQKAIKEKMEKFFAPFLQESINKIGKGRYEVTYKVGANNQPELKNTLDSPLFSPLKTNDEGPNIAKKSGLNPAYTFDKYIMGNTNRLAYAIASSVADNPGKMHNPYFLYAGVGLGKTHLLHAIGNKVLQKNPQSKVIYCTGENFANELIEGLRKGGRQYNSDVFRHKYRNADVLIIDDIQFIAGKATTQEEFFHTFNDLFMNQKQIVLASDRPPEEFKNIEERIVSRFKSGIMADIQKPDFELRTAILRSKRDTNRDEFPTEIVDLIAEIVDTNIRELEAAYTQVVTYGKAVGVPINAQTAKEALSNIIREEQHGPINLNTILKAVCNYYSIKQIDIKGKKRNKELVIPRQIAMYLMYELTKTPYMSIGEVLGGRDHTTVMHGVRKVEEEIKESIKIKADIANIKKFI